MNLKSAAMATGLVLTFAAGAWLSTIMLAPPQRSNRMAVQEQPPAPSPSKQPPMVRLPERLPDTAASDSILPPLPPLPPAPAMTTSGARRLSPKRPVPPAPEPPPPAEQAAPQPPEPPPPAIVEAPPAIVEAAKPAEAQPPEPQPAPVAEAAPEPPVLVAIPVVPPAETAPEADIDPGIAALSDLVTRAPSAPPPPSPPHHTEAPDPPSSRHRARHHMRFPPRPFRQRHLRPSRPDHTSRSRSAASRTRPMRPALRGVLGAKGWEAFVVGLDQQQRAYLEGRPGRALPDRSAGGSGIDRTVECGKSSR